MNAPLAAVCSFFLCVDVERQEEGFFGEGALEIGFDQSEAVEELLRAESYANVSTVRDLGGNARCVLGYAAENAAPAACNLENV